MEKMALRRCPFQCLIKTSSSYIDLFAIKACLNFEVIGYVCYKIIYQIQLKGQLTSRSYIQLALSLRTEKELNTKQTGFIFL